MDDIEFAIGPDDTQERNVYVVTHEDTRTEVYDANYVYAAEEEMDLTKVKKDLNQFADDVVGCKLRFRWILAQYRM